jgi:hypothetical protein
VRTTVTLDEDVAKALEALRRETGMGTSAALNKLVRRGLAASVAEARAPFRQRTSVLGLPRIPLDDVEQALALIEMPSGR